jgi:hypothetical protein
MLLLLLGCTRAVAPVLEVEPVEATPPEPADPDARLAWILGDDPLARRPRLPTATDGPLVAWAELARADDTRPAQWADLEARFPATVVVPLARGARLAALEASLGDPARAMEWYLPLPLGDAGQEQTRPPLDWLHASPDNLLPLLERSVVLGWLDAPSLPTAKLAAVFAEPGFGRVVATPAGTLLTARAARASDPAAAAEGWAALEQATALAAATAATDTDAEQAANKLALQAARDTLGGDPVPTLLRRAAEKLTADAGTDRSAGGALLALAAERWENRCPDTPCGGLDRVRAMATAGRWAPEVAPFADAWIVIASKDALDRLDVSWDHPSVTGAIDATVEVLLGSGGAVDRSLLLYPKPGPPLVLALSRAAGGGDLTGKDDLVHALRKRAGALAAATAPRVPEATRGPLEKIARRGR